MTTVELAKEIASLKQVYVSLRVEADALWSQLNLSAIEEQGAVTSEYYEDTDWIKGKEGWVGKIKMQGRGKTEMLSKGAPFAHIDWNIDKKRNNYFAVIEGMAVILTKINGQVQRTFINPDSDLYFVPRGIEKAGVVMEEPTIIRILLYLPGIEPDL